MRQDNTIYVLVLGPSIPMIIIIKTLHNSFINGVSVLDTWSQRTAPVLQWGLISDQSYISRGLIPLGYATH